MLCERLGLPMSGFVIQDKAVFEQMVADTRSRIEVISSTNQMARMLFSNFQTWLQSSTSPVELTQKMDKNLDGFVSIDEFATLLQQMTGERPPDWVTELVFSFAGVKNGQPLPLLNWYAFLAACGLSLPESLFKVFIPLEVSVQTSTVVANEGDSITFSLTFNQAVDEYLIRISNKGDTSVKPMVMTVPSSEIDSQSGDQQIVEFPNHGDYEITIIVNEEDVASCDVTILEKIEPVTSELEPKEEEVLEIDHESDELASPNEVPALEQASEPSSPDFEELYAQLSTTKLRSEWELLLSNRNHYFITGTLQDIERSLLGVGEYKNGYSLILNSNGVPVQAMIPAKVESLPKIGQTLNIDFMPTLWSIATLSVHGEVCSTVE